MLVLVIFRIVLQLLLTSLFLRWDTEAQKYETIFPRLHTPALPHWHIFRQKVAPFLHLQLRSNPSPMLLTYANSTVGGCRSNSEWATRHSAEHMGTLCKLGDPSMIHQSFLVPVSRFQKEKELLTTLGEFPAFKGLYFCKQHGPKCTPTHALPEGTQVPQQQTSNPESRYLHDKWDIILQPGTFLWGFLGGFLFIMKNMTMTLQQPNGTLCLQYCPFQVLFSSNVKFTKCQRDHTFSLLKSLHHVSTATGPLSIQRWPAKMFSFYPTAKIKSTYWGEGQKPKVTSQDRRHGMCRRGQASCLRSSKGWLRHHGQAHRLPALGMADTLRLWHHRSKLPHLD